MMTPRRRSTDSRRNRAGAAPSVTAAAEWLADKVIRGLRGNWLPPGCFRRWALQQVRGHSLTCAHMISKQNAQPGRLGANDQGPTTALPSRFSLVFNNREADSCPAV